MSCKYNNSMYTTSNPFIDDVELDESFDEKMEEFLHSFKKKKEYIPPKFWRKSDETFPRIYYELYKIGKTDLIHFLEFLVEYKKEDIEKFEFLLEDFLQNQKNRIKIDEYR